MFKRGTDSSFPSYANDDGLIAAFKTLLFYTAIIITSAICS
jgi:hypothetical protein